MMEKPRYPNYLDYLTLKRDVLPCGVKVVTNSMRPDLAYVPGEPFETYVIFDIQGNYDCGVVRHRDRRDALKYHNTAVNVLREVIHA